MIETQANIEMAATIWAWAGPDKDWDLEDLARFINKPIELVRQYWQYWQDRIDRGEVDSTLCVPGGTITIKLPEVADDANTQHRT